MAILFVQSIGYSSGSTNSITATLNGIAAGNFLASMNGAFVSGGGPANTAPSDDKLNTWNTTTAPTIHDNTNALINYAMSVAAGNTVLTVDYGTGFAIDGEFAEFSGLATSSAIDKQTEDGSASDSTPTVGPTAATTVADELVLVCLATGNAGSPAGIDVPATTSYNNLWFQDNNVNNVGSSGDYKIVSATGTQDAAWGTLAAASSWCSKIATFKIAGAASDTLMAQVCM